MYHNHKDAYNQFLNAIEMFGFTKVYVLEKKKDQIVMKILFMHIFFMISPLF